MMREAVRWRGGFGDAVVGCVNVPAATVNLASDRRARVDVRVGAARSHTSAATTTL